MRQFSMLTTKIAKHLQSLNVSVKEARDHMGPLNGYIQKLLFKNKQVSKV